jgi:hypothetical protein
MVFAWGTPRRARRWRKRSRILCRASLARCSEEREGEQLSSPLGLALVRSCGKGAFGSSSLGPSLFLPDPAARPLSLSSPALSSHAVGDFAELLLRAVVKSARESSFRRLSGSRSCARVERRRNQIRQMRVYGFCMGNAAPRASVAQEIQDNGQLALAARRSPCKNHKRAFVGFGCVVESSRVTLPSFSCARIMDS